MTPHLNWLDRAINFVSPSAGVRRMAWRSAGENYDAGGHGRSNAGWHAVNMSGEQTDRIWRDTIRARARDLERNSDVEQGIVRARVRNVVGTGFQLQARIETSSGAEDDTRNRAVEMLWEEWCRPRYCDVSGRLSFSQMLQMAERRLTVDGGILFIKCYTTGGPVPFCLQVREVDDLDTSLNGIKIGDNHVVGGIEIDARNKPVAYYLRVMTPDGFWSGQSQRIDAGRVIYLQDITRPSQIREMSPLSCSLERIRDTHEFINVVSVKERVAACLAAFIKKITPTGGFGRSVGAAGGQTDSQSGYPQRTLTPGMITELQPGEELQVVTPPNSGTAAADFVRVQQRLAGAGQGLSYEVISRDMSQVNYSSARQGFLEDQREYRMRQQYLIEHLCREVYTEFLISAVLAGAVPIPPAAFWADKARYMAHEFLPPGWSWIDPLKESNANRIGLMTHQITLAEICAQNGRDWRDVLHQRAAEERLARELGVQSIFGGGIAAGGTNAKAGNEE